MTFAGEDKTPEDFPLLARCRAYVLNYEPMFHPKSELVREIMAVYREWGKVSEVIAECGYSPVCTDICVAYSKRPRNLLPSPLKNL